MLQGKYLFTNFLELLFCLSDGVHIVKRQLAQIILHYSFQTNSFFPIHGKSLLFVA